VERKYSGLWECLSPQHEADMFHRGLEADQKVIAAHGCYAMTATTALTAQNTQGVNDIHLTPPDFVRKQIDACISDIGVDVVKTGLLPPILLDSTVIYW
jgi:hydroxymethylpyrimidine/phosphomethylpyrimidine kinase